MPSDSLGAASPAKIQLHSLICVVDHATQPSAQHRAAISALLRLKISVYAIVSAQDFGFYQCVLISIKYYRASHQGLVEETLAIHTAAKTWNSVVTANLALEFVVVGQLLIYSLLVDCASVGHSKLTFLNITQRIDDNPFGTSYANNFGGTIRAATVIDEARNTTLLRRINDGSFVDAE